MPCLHDALELQPLEHGVGPGDVRAYRARLRRRQLALGGVVELGGVIVRAPAEVLHAVARVVGRDAIEPRRELGVAAEGVDVLEDGHEHFLRDVLGLLAAADHAEDDVEDLVLVQPHDFGERALVPLLQAADQHAFAKRRHGERRGSTAHASLDHRSAASSRAARTACSVDEDAEAEHEEILDSALDLGSIAEVDAERRSRGSRGRR